MPKKTEEMKEGVKEQGREGRSHEEQWKCAEMLVTTVSIKIPSTKFLCGIQRRGDDYTSGRLGGGV